MQQKNIAIFISYAHQDEILRQELENHLIRLERKGDISVWHDRKISVGEEWKNEIDKYLQQADFILLLVSSDFIASDYCYGTEMTKAMERHESGEAIVIPVILRPITWTDTPFGKLQPLPKEGKPITTWTNLDEAFQNVEQGITEKVKEVRSKAASEQPKPINQNSPQIPTQPQRTHKHSILLTRVFLVAIVVFSIIISSLTIFKNAHFPPVNPQTLPQTATTHNIPTLAASKTHIANPDPTANNTTPLVIASSAAEPATPTNPTPLVTNLTFQESLPLIKNNDTTSQCIPTNTNNGAIINTHNGYIKRCTSNTPPIHPQFTAQVTMTIQQGSSGGGGLAIHYQNPSQPYYAIVVFQKPGDPSKKCFQIVKIPGPINDTYVTPFTENNYANHREISTGTPVPYPDTCFINSSDGDPITLMVAVKNNFIDTYINDKLVKEGVPDELSGGTIGLLGFSYGTPRNPINTPQAEAAAEVTFSNAKMSTP